MVQTSSSHWDNGRQHDDSGQETFRDIAQTDLQDNRSIAVPGNLSFPLSDEQSLSWAASCTVPAMTVIAAFTAQGRSNGNGKGNDDTRFDNAL